MPTSPVTVIVPVKPPARGKSRLTGISAERRAALAEGFALDTVSAALATPQVEHVLVVTDDARFAARCTELGASAFPDGASELNQSLVQASAEATRRWRGQRHAVLCADLPALLPDVLGAVLDAIGADPAFVPDQRGDGTTCYLASAGLFAPAFGPGSARAHRDAGAIEIAAVRDASEAYVDLTCLRRDVDDTDDLAAVLALGVGAHTTAALLG